MALRSALASLPARLRATPAATAAGGWRRLLSDDPKDGRPEDTLKAQNEKNILKEQVDKYNKEIKELKDQIERAETEKQLLKYQIQKNEKNCLKDQLKDSRKEIKQLKDQHDNAETESQLLKDQILKDVPVMLENIISKEALVLETQLTNHRQHIDESVSKTQRHLERIKDEGGAIVANLKQMCGRRLKNGERGVKALEDKNAAYPEKLIGKMQETQYKLGLAATCVLAVIGVVTLLAFKIKLGK